MAWCSTPSLFSRKLPELRELGVEVDGQLYVSNRAQVILPYHRMIELAAESAPGRQEDRHHQPRHRPGLRRQDGAQRPAHR